MYKGRIIMTFIFFLLILHNHFVSIREVITAVWVLVVYAGIVLGDDVPLYGEVIPHEGVHSLVNLKVVFL